MAIEEKEVVGGIQVKDDAEIIIRVTEINEITGVDIREYVDSENYTGWTKKGVWVKKDKWDDLKKLINKVDMG